MTTKSSLILHLKTLNSNMVKIADMMEETYPDNAIELQGAASQVLEWVVDIQQEMEEK